jgi:hypothetical protein
VCLEPPGDALGGTHAIITAADGRRQRRSQPVADGGQGAGHILQNPVGILLFPSRSAQTVHSEMDQRRERALAVLGSRKDGRKGMVDQHNLVGNESLEGKHASWCIG